METTRPYNVHPSVVGFHNSHAQVKALCGPVGSGKTSAMCFEIWFALREAREPLPWLIARESYRQLHDSTRRTWEYWFGACSRYLKVDERMLVTVENVFGDTLIHELDFRHARRPEDASNLLSTEYAGAWLEEVVPAYQMDAGVVGAGLPKELFDLVLTRMRHPGAHRSHVLLSFNPPHRYHWVYQEFFARTAEELATRDYALFRSPAYENRANLPARYYERLLEQFGPGSDLARRFVLGEAVTLYPGVRVFPEASEAMHFRTALEVLPGVELVIGFDFGLTPCAVVCQMLPSGRLQVYAEIQLFNAGIERLAAHLHELLKAPDTVRGGPRFKGNTWRCWGDPAGSAKAPTDERTCFDILRHNGFDVQPGAVDWESRRQALKMRLERLVDGEPAILIDQQSCPVLSEGLLGGFSYPKSLDGRIAGKPLKNNFSHTADALMYLCTGEFARASGIPLGIKAEPKRKPWNPLEDNPRVPQGGSWMVH